MSQTKAGQPKARVTGPIVRPLSPHLQIWRWHATMAGSILHRVSGVALYAGALLVVAWLAALVAGEDWYAQFLAIAASPIGLLVWFAMSAAAIYHLASGLKHLIWDLGAGLTPKTADLLTNMTLWFAVIVTLAFWTGLFVTGRVTL